MAAAPPRAAGSRATPPATASRTTASPSAMPWLCWPRPGAAATASSGVAGSAPGGAARVPVDEQGASADQRCEHGHGGQHPDCARAGQHAHGEPEVHGHQAQAESPVDVGDSLAHRRGPATGHHRQQVAQGTQEHLEDTAARRPRPSRSPCSGSPSPRPGSARAPGRRRPGTTRSSRPRPASTRRGTMPAGAGASRPPWVRPSRRSRPGTRRSRRRRAGRAEASTPAVVTRVPRTNAGSARRALRSAPGANRVRSIVGHSVTSVPMMGSPTQPIRFTDTCASSSWLCTVGACDPSARATPRAIPGISRSPAAT